MDKDKNIKIADFGIYAVMPMKKNKILISNYTAVGRRDYIYPETNEGKAYDCRYDIYSLGLTLLYLMPYDNPIEMIKDIIPGQYKWRINK